jgi:hypothetical protein
MRYVLVEDVTNKILEEVEGDREFRTGTPPDLPQKPFRWLPLEVTNPNVDSNKEVKEGPTITVEPKRVTKKWNVRKKTAKELDADKELQLPRSDSIQFKAMMDVENRTLALEKKPKLTVAEYRTALKKLL